MIFGFYIYTPKPVIEENSTWKIDVCIQYFDGFWRGTEVVKEAPGKDDPTGG